MELIDFEILSVKPVQDLPLRVEVGSLHGRLEDECIGPYSLLWGGLDAGVRVPAVIVHLPHSFDIAAAAHPPTGDLLVLLSWVPAPVILGYLWLMTRDGFFILHYQADDLVFLERSKTG